MQQALFDQFYYVIFLVSFITLTAVGRSIHLYLAWWRPTIDEKHTQRKRYVFAAIGMIISASMLIFPMTQYSFSEIMLGVAELPKTRALIFWFVVAANMVNIIFSMAFMVNSYMRPTYYARKDFATGKMLLIRDLGFPSRSSQW